MVFENKRYSIEKKEQKAGPKPDGIFRFRACLLSKDQKGDEKNQMLTRFAAKEILLHGHRLCEPKSGKNLWAQSRLVFETKPHCGRPDYS